MLFTVFQYIPILEEENASHMELSKKMTQDDTDGSDGDTDDDCNDDDSEQDSFISTKTLRTIYFTQLQKNHFHAFCCYERLLEKKPTRPPKV